MKMNSTKLVAVATAILMASASAFAAVKNGASLKGTDYTKGGNNAKGGGVIAWNSYSSVDPTTFSHDLSSGDLTVLKDGDYLVAVTIPLSTINSERNTHRADLMVNGTAVPTAVGESSYLRFTNAHTEASDHFAVLVSLTANDVLTVKTTPTAANALSSFIGTCSLYAELVEGDRNVFSASATEIQSGAELNVAPDTGDQGLVWTTARKGSGYSHSDGDAEITLKDGGNYMVYANVPLRGNVVRGSVGLTINLDDEYVEGARGQQGYIRDANNHKDASIHFSGVISAEAGQVLTVITEQLAAAGSIKVQANRAASIFIEKLGDGGLYADAFYETTAGENLNPNNKLALSLTGDGSSDDVIDDAYYSNEGDSEENIVIKKAGSYLLSFNSTFTGGNARANPRVTVEVNGSVVPGATSTAHYNRHSNGHDEVTGSFVALLSDLAVDDVVTISVQREANGGIVTSPEGGKVVLQAKATYETAAGDQSPPRFSSFSGSLSGFSAIVEDFGLKLDAATVKATLNGESVDVTVDSANGLHSINYAFTDFPPTGSEHALNIAFNDTGGNANSMDFAFTVNTQYQMISPAFSMSAVNKDKGGFQVNLSQISAIQTEGPTQIHGNSWVNAEKQLRGEFLNPNEVDDDDNPLPYLNEADPDAWEGWSIAPADVDYVNMNQDEDGNIGNFGEDQTLPNIPGWGDSTDGIAGEFLTVLHLKKGFQTLGVNSDDGFRATMGLNFHDMEAQQIGLFDGGRGAADSLFNIVVPEEGYYPLRVLWWEGGGGANIEIFSIVDDKKVLVNDLDNADAIKAYNIGSSTGRTYFGSVSPPPDDTFTTENSISATIIEGGTKPKSGSIKVLLNGEEVDASVNSADGVVTVIAEPDGGLGIGSHTAKIVFTETTDPETERSFEWSFEVTAFSAKMRELVDGEPNPIAYWDFDFADVPDLTFEHVFNLESVMTNAKYTEDKGGHTGETGDYAMDFLQGAANLLVPDGEFLNIASAFDKISVSLWQKNHTTPNSSSFWGYSPSSNNGFRGIQAHIPWGNLQIYFDTAGCCGGATQRINRAVDADHEWTEWHHYVFVKDKGHKSIWIDGTLFHEGDNSLVLPSDFDFLYIGSNGAGGNSASGIIDDFAVFASALTEEQIIALSEGNTDILPEKREIVVPQPDIPILLSKSPTSAGPVGEDEISIRFRGIDFTGLSITVNDTAVDPTITSDAMFTTITADGAFSLGENVITVSWNGESETWKYFQFSVAEGQTGLASYSVETVGAVPGPWAFEGVWVSEGSVAGCGGPYHDFLTSPNYIVSADGEVTLSFEHRHAFEGAMWDSGQLWIRVNGGDYTDVGIDAFTANGYTDVAIVGNGIAKGQNGFGNTSAGYADGTYITTTANLGSFSAGDAVSVRFVALYDDCATGTNPNWVIASVSSDQMTIKPIEGGLVAHWPMNEGSGDVFKDVVGGFDGFLPLAQDGAQTEVSWGEGPPTQANSVEFSGANSFIATRFPGIGGSEPRTVAFWVRTTDANAVYLAWGSNATARKWHIRANGASGVMRTEFAGGQNFATTSIIDGEWHHVASVFPNGATEGEQILHYIDGVLDPQAGGTSLTVDTEIVTDADIDWTNANSAESYPVHIGGRLTHGWGNMLIGSMADVRIYNQGLSEDQIRFIFEGKAEGGMNLEGPTVVDFGDLSGDASYEFFFKAIKAGASTAIAGNDAFAFKLDQWNEQGVFGTTVFGVADNVFTAVEGKSVASVFDRDVHVVLVNDTAAGETRLYVNGDHVGVLDGNFELAGESKVMGARIEANTDPMGDGSVMHKWAVYNSALTGAEIADLAAAAGGGGGDAPALSIVNNGDGTVTVTFEGTLQSAASVNGPWSDVDAPSPLTIPADQAQQYARAVAE